MKLIFRNLEQLIIIPYHLGVMQKICQPVINVNLRRTLSRHVPQFQETRPLFGIESNRTRNLPVDYSRKKRAPAVSWSALASTFLTAVNPALVSTSLCSRTFAKFTIVINSRSWIKGVFFTECWFIQEVRIEWRHCIYDRMPSMWADTDVQPFNIHGFLSLKGAEYSWG